MINPATLFNKIKSRLFLVFVLIFIQLLGAGITFGQPIVRKSVPGDRKMEQRAASLARLGRPEEAVDIYLQLLYKNPSNSNIYFRVSNLMPGKDYAPTLLQILDDILKSQSKNTRLAAERGRLLVLLDRKQEAIESWDALIQQRQNDRFAYTSVTNAMLQAGVIDEAVLLLENGRKQIGDPAAFAYDLARIYAAKHDYAKAGNEYLAHLDHNSGMLDHISNQLIRLLENDGAFELIDQSFDAILLTPGDHQSILLARAKLYLHQKEYERCVETILSTDVSKSMNNVFDIADDLAAEKAWGAAADLYLFISANSHDRRQTGEALLELASTYEHRLQYREPYRSLSGYFSGNQFLKLDVQFTAGNDASLTRTLKLYDSLQTLLPKTQEAFEASYHIAEIQLTVNADVDRAINGFRYILDNSRGRELRLSAGTRLVDSYLVRGDTTSAMRSLDDLIRKMNMDEDDPKILTSTIKILLHKGDIPGMQKELLNLSGAALPSDPIFNDGLELTALLEGNGEPDDPQLKNYIKAEKLIGQHKLSEAIDLLSQIEGDAETIADEAAVRSIQLQLSLKEFNQATAAMDSFLETYEESEFRPNVLIWRGEYWQYMQQNPVAAIPYYEEVIVNYPGYLGIQELRIRLRNLLGDGS